MAAASVRKIFVNLPVSDLKRSMDFFTALGFSFNPQFSDDNAACMIVSEDAFVMLLTGAYFANFTPRPICPRDHVEVLTAVSVATRDDVDRLADEALARGGRQATEPKDHGFMYVRTFLDPDGHHWELVWMNPVHVH
jgi:predicted lactoylglutathione lyase